MRERFIDINFQGTSLATIERAIAVIDEMAQQGYTLTLRQLYYQFVSRNWLRNTENSYKNLGEIISRGRLAGMIDWDAIEDRTRFLRSISDWKSPAHWQLDRSRQYAEDLWRDQECRLEVWIEKDALVGVVERACDRWRVPLFSCRGYVSQSELHEAGRRHYSHSVNDQPVTVIHLGDHDPSGIDMTRDITERLDMFSYQTSDVRRVALTMDQVRMYNPPPNPAKVTDSRHAGYQELYGNDSWELDALEPSVIDKLVDDTIREYVDEDKFNVNLIAEQSHFRELQQLAKHYDGVINHVWSGIRSID